uniref:Uncharacterized protein n=1 Tax=Schistosoma mansoni TaxID=6183 RepID=A0A5K4F6Z5_SCHMA
MIALLSVSKGAKRRNVTTDKTNNTTNSQSVSSRIMSGLGWFWPFFKQLPYHVCRIGNLFGLGY